MVRIIVMQKNLFCVLIVIPPFFYIIIYNL